MVDAITSSTAEDAHPGHGVADAVQAGAAIYTAGTGTEAGTVVTATRGREIGIALVRLEHVFTAAASLPQASFTCGQLQQQGKEKEEGGTDVGASAAAVTFFQPAWWPALDPVTGKPVYE